MNKQLNDKYRKKKVNRLVIKSFRSINKWVSNDIINICEDAFVKIDPSISISSIEKIIYFTKRTLTNKHIGSNRVARWIYKGTQRVLSKNINESLFVICMPPFLFDILGFYNTKGIKIAYIIDAWENSIEYIAANIDAADIILIAYQDSIDFLKKHIPYSLMEKVHLFPNFIDPIVYPNKSLNKLYDIIQVGRRNDILHRWAIKYSTEKKRSYLYQKRNQRGMYYFEDRSWEGSNFQLSYLSLVETLARSKIALVSPPDTTNSKRTGRISPLTHRYLEAAMCYAVPVGLTPTGGEYVNFFPKTFTIVPKDYREFEEICNQLIKDADLRLEIANANRNYVMANHITEVRYKRLQQILSKYRRD